MFREFFCVRGIVGVEYCAPPPNKHFAVRSRFTLQRQVLHPISEVVGRSGPGEDVQISNTLADGNRKARLNTSSRRDSGNRWSCLTSTGRRRNRNRSLSSKDSSTR